MITNVLQKCLALLQEWFSKTKLEDSCDTWKDYINIKMKGGEKVTEFIRRYEMIEIKLKSLNVPQHPRILAIHLLNSTTLSPEEKRNVLSKAETDDDEKIYPAIKKCVRELKSVLVEGSEKKNETNNTFYGDNRPSRRDHHENNYGNNRERSQSGYRYRQRSYGKSDQNNRNKARSISRQRRDGSRGRSNSRPRYPSNDKTPSREWKNDKSSSSDWKNNKSRL